MYNNEVLISKDFSNKLTFICQMPLKPTNELNHRFHEIWVGNAHIIYLLYQYLYFFYLHIIENLTGKMPVFFNYLVYTSDGDIF